MHIPTCYILQQTLSEAGHSVPHTLRVSLYLCSSVSHMHNYCCSYWFQKVYTSENTEEISVDICIELQCCFYKRSLESEVKSHFVIAVKMQWLLYSLLQLRKIIIQFLARLFRISLPQRKEKGHITHLAFHNESSRFKRCTFLSSLFFCSSEGRVSQFHQGAPATKRRHAVCLRNKRFQPLLPNLQGRGARTLLNSSIVSPFASTHLCRDRGGSEACFVSGMRTQPSKIITVWSS